MRVFPRVALAVIVLLTAPMLLANHLQADCPMTLVATDAPPSGADFSTSPHGVFRFGTQVFALRGGWLTTYTVNDVGNLTLARQDFIGSLGARETNGGVAFNNGYLFLSSEAGLEIYDLRGVKAGGTAPILVSRTAGLHYRRLAVNGTTLAGLYPGTDLPCYPNGFTCYTTIDLFNISTLAAPRRVGVISTATTENSLVAFNDIAFNYGFLVAAGQTGSASYNVTNPAAPFRVGNATQPGTFVVSNGTSLVGIGNPGSILVYSFLPDGTFAPDFMYTISPGLQIDRSNPLMFHPEAAFDEAGSRLITMVDEINPLTKQPARTIAFDVFDFDTPMYEGTDPRLYESVSQTTGDEVKWDPLAVGPYVYTVGSLNGVQTWGACGLMSGKIELDSVTQLTCGGAEIHGWVTGVEKIANVELFLDQAFSPFNSGSLGTGTLSVLPRTDVSSSTPVITWRVSTTALDQTPTGDYILRAVGQDVLGNRRQFASMRVYFPGPPNNCTQRRRQSAIHF